MFFIALLILAALSITGVAGYFSILGLMAIFPASTTAVAAMGGVLELSKLVTASWVYRNWQESNRLLKTYFVSAVMVLSFITSMGVFGYLSKAHLEHSITTGDNSLQIVRVEEKIAQEQRTLSGAQRQITQLDDALSKYIEMGSVSRGLSARQAQAKERKDLNALITNSQANLDKLQDEKTNLQTSQLSIEAEIGPIKYVAELFYGNGDKSTVDKAVRLMILILICVLDPLAILLVVAANISIKQLTLGSKPATIEEVSEIEETPVEESSLDVSPSTMAPPENQVATEMDWFPMEKNRVEISDDQGSTHGVPAPDPKRKRDLEREAAANTVLIDKDNIRRM
jgi:hypothetical protein